MVVTPYYDSLMAKLMVHAPDRPAAIAKLLRALSLTQVCFGTRLALVCLPEPAVRHFTAKGHTTLMLPQCQIKGLLQALSLTQVPFEAPVLGTLAA